MPLNPLRIAMWSGPRNISTALMRAWENRDDCVVWDEPLYGYYLDATGIPHPGAAEVIADQGSNAQAIIAACMNLSDSETMCLSSIARISPSEATPIRSSTICP